MNPNNPIDRGICPLITFGLRLLALSLTLTFPLRGEDFNVTGGNGIDYFIDGQSDPGLTLERGVTYVFLLSNVATHPFYIKTSLGFGSSGRYDEGVSNNGATSGNVTLSVTANTPSTLFYQCGAHSAMNAVLNIVTPASPPEVKVVFIGIGDYVTVKSTGTNGWTAVPEFTCGVPATNWTEVAGFTNSFSGGTNTTTFGLLDPICGSSSVLLRIRNDPE